MSAHGSPTGSPTAGGGITMDGAEVAQRLVAAAEAASQAASAAVQIVTQVQQQQQGQGASSSTGAMTDEKSWYRLLPKPQVFEPSNREQEISQWRDWAWSLEQYLASLDPQYVMEIKTLRENPQTEVDASVQTDSEQKRSVFLYGLLASLVKQRPLLVVKQVKMSNGYEAYRQLIQSCEPLNKNRAMSLLSIIMNWPAFNSKASLLSQVLRLETAYAEYEKLGNKLADDIKAAVLLRSVTGNVKPWLQLQVNDKTSFSQLRELVLTYDQQTTRWSESMVLGQVDDPMDVSRVKGKDKGKDKGKGKSKDKGKTPWYDKGKGYGNSKGYGQSSDSKGKGKADKGKGKAKSSSKDMSSVVCHKCHKVGHYARDCWSKEKVRQVNEKGGDNTHATPSAQPETSPTSPQSSKSVRRVALTFDLQDGETESAENQSVRAVTCEQFFIGEDADDDVVFTSEHVPELHLLKDMDYEDHGQVRDDPISSTSSSPTTWSLDNYEVDFDDKHNLRRFGSSSWAPTSEMEKKKEQILGGKLFVRAVWTEEVSIILDSGSDATVLPYEYVETGKDTNNLSQLWDAQGQKIPTQGCREVQIGLQGEEGEHITIKDRGHISQHVSQPLISFGRLLKRGWCIGLENGFPKLVHGATGAKVPIEFKNDSLVIKGSIRRIQHVRHVPASVPINWRNLGRGWSSTARGFPICLRPSLAFVNPSDEFSLEEWPYRTTIGYDGSTWEMLEFCEDMRMMDNLSERVDSKWQRLLTILTLEILPPEQIGFATEGVDGHDQASSSAQAPVASQPVQQVQPEQADQGVQAEVPGAEVGGAVLPPHLELQTSRDVLEIGGVKVYPTSSVKVLRTACAYFEISQGGSKVKLWNRLLAHMDKMNLKATQEIVQQAKQDSERVPVEQKLNKRPEDPDEILKHNLNHLPYTSWCPSCVKGKGRPDQHKENAEKYTKRSLPCISFDLFYTSKKLKEPMVAVGEKDELNKLVCLAIVDSMTGAVSAVPLLNKGDSKMMAKEIVRFVQWLGYSSLSLRCDQEPTTLRVQQLCQQSLNRLGVKAVLENPHIKDSSSNAMVESAIHRLRQMSTVLQCGLEEHLGCDIPITHPLASWSMVHAGWLMNRYVCRGGMTPFEVANGRPYVGKICEFAEPILAYVYTKPGPKGGARWEEAIFLGKTNSNDMFVVGIGNTLMLTRSIKRVFSEWDEKLHMYHELSVQSWMVEVLGNRMEKRVKKKPEAIGFPEEGPGPDEAASDPPTEDEMNEEFLQVDFPDSMTLSELASVPMPLTPRPVTQTPVPLPAPGSVVPPVRAEPVQQPGEASTEMVEPDAKRRRLAVRRVGSEELCHVDEDIENNFTEELEDYDMKNFWGDADDDEESLRCPVFEAEPYNEADSVWRPASEAEPHSEAESLWFPASEAEPQIPWEELRRLDGVADRVEVARLSAMGVLLKPGTYSGSLASPLSAKFVRSWRRKTKDGEFMWLRRSRLVAREFAFVESRYDVYAPASSASCQRIIPALCMCQLFNNAVMGSLDITDAYLTVKQAEPRAIKLMAEPDAEMSFDAEGWIIDRCLPGQRDGARRWYDHFLDKLKEEFGATACLEQPSFLKIEGGGILLLHVDDVLFLMDQNFLETEFKARLNKHFKFSLSYAPRTGGSFEFLKKMFELSPGYEKLTIIPQTKHIKQIYDIYTKYNGKPARLHNTPVNAQLYDTDHTQLLDAERAGIFRSLVGGIMYVSGDRGDCQFAAKSLAAYLKSPTKHAWMSLGRLVGYLKKTEGYCNTMSKTSPSMSVFAKVSEATTDGQVLLLESFSDADWNSKCTSCGVHYIAGNLVHSTSRSQKAISLSSTESEWYAALSTTIDTLFLIHILTFLVHKPDAVLRADNTAIISIGTKLGTARLKHIEGKLLWLQSKVANNILKMSAVRTQYNVADIGTKGLGRLKHLGFCYMLGMSCDGEAVGEREFEEINKQELLKQQNKKLVRHVQFGTALSREALVLSLLATAQADPMEHEEFHDDSSNALSSTSWTRWTSWWSTIFVAVLAILVGWYYKMSTRSGDREDHGDHEGDQQHDGDPVVQDEVDDGDARDRSKSRSRSRSRTRSDSRDHSFEEEGEEEQREMDEEDIEFPRTKNHTAIAGLAVHLLNKVRLGFPEHVCLRALWHLMLLSLMNSDDSDGRVEFVTEFLQAMETMDDDLYMQELFQKLEGEAGHMLRKPTLDDAHTFFMRHFDTIPGNRLYEIVEVMEVEFKQFAESLILMGYDSDVENSLRGNVPPPGDANVNSAAAESGDNILLDEGALHAEQDGGSNECVDATEHGHARDDETSWDDGFINVDVDESSDESPLTRERRYRQSGLDEVSNPDLWQDIHHFALQESVRAFRLGQQEGPGGHAEADVARADDEESEGYEPSIASETEMQTLGGMDVDEGVDTGDQEPEGEHNLGLTSSAEKSDQDDVSGEESFEQLLRETRETIDRTVKQFMDLAEQAEVAGDYELAAHYVAEANNVDIL